MKLASGCKNPQETLSCGEVAIESVVSTVQLVSFGRATYGLGLSKEGERKAHKLVAYSPRTKIATEMGMPGNKAVMGFVYSTNVPSMRDDRGALAMKLKRKIDRIFAR